MGVYRETAVAAARIGRRIAYERITRPKATTRDDVPCSTSAVTAAWLTAVLCDKVDGARVSTVEVVPVSEGTNVRDRLLLGYNDAGRAAGLPPSVFTKSLPSVVTRMIGGFQGTARVEGRFFMLVRPLLDIEAPAGYFAAFDRKTYASIVIMEDLVATKHATFCDPTTPVSKEMAEDMVDVMAALHARFYDDPVLARDHRWIAPFPRWFERGAAKMGMEQYTRKAFAVAPEVVPDDLLRRRDEVWPAALAALAVHTAEPVGLLHSDIHIGNWYRTGGGRMGLCDWQALCRGHGSRDVAYALSTSLLPEDRRSWERDLLARYLDRLAALTGRAQEFERNFLFYRQQQVLALLMWTVTLCHSPLLPAMQPRDISLEMIRRISMAMDDLATLDALAG